MVLKVNSFKLDSELLKEIKIKSAKEGVTQSELITKYLKYGLENDI